MNAQVFEHDRIGIFLQRSTVGDWLPAFSGFESQRQPQLVAGDASHIDSVYRINAEGVLGVSGTTPRSSAWYIELQCPGAAVEGRA